MFKAPGFLQNILDFFFVAMSKLITKSLQLFQKHTYILRIIFVSLVKLKSSSKSDLMNFKF